MTAEIAARHKLLVLYTNRGELDAEREEMCNDCFQEWPCDAATALALLAVETARADVASQRSDTAQLAAENTRLNERVAALTPTGDELDDLLAEISRAAYASDARQSVEDFFERKWSVLSPFTVALLNPKAGEGDE